MSDFVDRRELLRTRRARFVRMSHGVESANARAVHQTRVASRRLRELLPVLQLDARTSRKLGRRLRKVTRRLGPLRELDVLAALMADLRARATREKPALRLLARRIETARQMARAELQDKPIPRQIERTRRALEQAARRVEGVGGGRERKIGWRWALEARVARRAASLSEALRQAGAVYLAERLHAVRIALKKLRYAVELSVDASGEKTSADLRVLRRSQEALGRMHDLQVLVDFVREVQVSLSPRDASMEQGLDEVVRTLENSCRRLHASHVRQRPALLEMSARLSAASSADAKAAVRRTG